MYLKKQKYNKMENRIKIENFTFYRNGSRYYFEEKLSGTDGEIILGSGDFGRGKSETQIYVSHIELSVSNENEPTDNEIETIKLLFDKNLDLILNAEKI